MAQTNQATGAAKVLEHLTSALAESLSSITGQSFSVTSSESEGPELPNPIIWQQVFSSAPEPGVWLSAGKDMWGAAGAIVMSAVGIESASDEDCRSTWLEIAGQTMAGLAMRVTGDVQHEVTS